MRASTWGFAIVQMIHLLALAVLGGVILVVDLNLLGIAMRRRNACELARDVSPLFAGSLVVMILSGVVMISEEAEKVYSHPAFRFKMFAFVLAVLFHFTVHRRLVREPVCIAARSRWVGVCSLFLWLCV